MMARYYGPKSFGQITFAHSLATTFILFADFGFDILLTNELARSKNIGRELFQRYFSLKLIFTFLSFISMCIFVFTNNVSIEMQILALVFSLYMVFTTQSNFIFAFFRGYEKFYYESIISVLMNIGLLVIVFTMMISKTDILFIAIGFVASRFLGLVLGIYNSFKIIPNLSYKPVLKGFNEIKSFVFVFGFHFLFSYLFFQLDTILLAIWKNEYEVGIYQAVYKLIMLPLVLPEIFNNTLLPSLSKYYIEENEKWKTLGKLMYKCLFLLIIPMFLVLFVFSEQVINIIYGANDYVASVSILKIFSIILLIRFLLEPFALMITTSNRQSVRLYTVIAATILNFMLNYFAIPKYGAYGAAIVSMITNMFVALVYFAASWVLFKDWIINLKTLLVIMLIPFSTYILNIYNHISVFIFVPLIVFVAILTYYFYLTKRERNLIFSTNFNFSFIKK
jgi:O-antigen/teichoic acid export membrane protein